MLTDPLIATRAIHFAAAVMVAGIAFFEWLVAMPAFQATHTLPLTMVTRFRTRMAYMLWASLAVAIISGSAWLLLLAGRIADRSVSEVVADGTAWVVLTQTRFGLDWQLRLLVAVLLAGYPVLFRLKRAPLSNGYGFAHVLLAAAFLGALAWAGHGGATPGTEGSVHVSADVVHLIAVGAWLGGLIPLVLLLERLRRSTEEGLALTTCEVTRRFSNLGIIAVGAILISGIINAWFLVGSVSGLIETGYGRLLLLKIALFGAMVCLAAVNRLRLLPRLSSWAGGRTGSLDAHTVRTLQRNTIFEILLGLGVIIIVGALGVTPPASEFHSHIH
ncbi:MAG TPA: copper homeostasis membrane protein CopD [Rhizomicrobium sp.]